MGIGQPVAPVFHTIQWARFRALTFSKLLPDGDLLFPGRKKGEAAAAGVLFQQAPPDPMPVTVHGHPSCPEPRPPAAGSSLPPLALLASSPWHRGDTRLWFLALLTQNHCPGCRQGATSTHSIQDAFRSETPRLRERARCSACTHRPRVRRARAPKLLQRGTRPPLLAAGGSRRCQDPAGTGKSREPAACGAPVPALPSQGLHELQDSQLQSSTRGSGPPLTSGETKARSFSDFPKAAGHLG